MGINVKPEEEVTVVHNEDGSMSLYAGTESIPLAAASSLTGDLRADNTLTLQATYSSNKSWSVLSGGSSTVGYVTPDPQPLVHALRQLTSAVKAGAPCRCAPTEVCPECHDLSLALAGAERALTPYDVATYSLREYEDTVLTGVTHVTGGTLSVSTSGTSFTTSTAGTTDVG